MHLRCILMDFLDSDLYPERSSLGFGFKSKVQDTVASLKNTGSEDKQGTCQASFSLYFTCSISALCSSANKYSGLNLSLLRSQFCTDNLLEQKAIKGARWHSRPVIQAGTWDVEQPSLLLCTVQMDQQHQKVPTEPPTENVSLQLCEEKTESDFWILCIIYQPATRPAMKTPQNPVLGIRPLQQVFFQVKFFCNFKMAKTIIPANKLFKWKSPSSFKASKST